MIVEVVEIVIRERGGRATSRQIGTVARSMRSAASAATALIGVLGTLAAARGFGGVIRGSVDAAAQIESYRTRLTNLLGSQEDANRAIEEFVELSSRTPFAVNEIVEGASTLAAAALGNRQRLEELTAIAANLAAVTGLSFQEAAGNLQRSLSAGIGAADLFRERGVRALIEEIEGIPDATELSARELEGSFRRIFGAGGVFGQVAENLSTTLGGALSNVADAAFNAQAALGDAIAPAVIQGARETIIPFFEDLQATISENSDEIEAFARDSVVVLTRAFGVLVEAGIGVLEILNRLRGAGTAFQGILATRELGQAENQLIRLQSQLEVAEQRGDQALGENLQSRIRATEARIEGLRFVVDDLAGDYRNAQQDAESFSATLDRLRGVAERLQGATIGAAEATDELGEAQTRLERQAGPAVDALARDAVLAGDVASLSSGGLSTVDLTGAADAQAEAQREEQQRLERVRRAGAEVGAEVSRGLLGALRGDAVDIGELVGGASAAAFQSSLEGVFEDIAEGLDSVLQDAFDGVDLGGIGGRLAGAIGIGLSILGSVISGSSATTTSAVSSAVTDARSFRGVVAGPDSIPIFEVGRSVETGIREAQEPVVALLADILAAVRANGPGAAGTPIPEPVDPLLTTESLV